MTQYFEWPEEIRHLSEAQVEQLYQRYLGGEKKAGLIAEFGLPTTLNSVLEVLPPMVSADLTCPYCDRPMWMRRPARGTPVSRYVYNCASCAHRYYASDPVARREAGRREMCNCGKCAKVRQQQIAVEAERDRLEQAARYNPFTPSVSDPDNHQLFCRECDSPNIDASMDKMILRTVCYDCSTISKFRAFEELPD
ncbi:hypothetical protein N8H74_21325 [Pseudomonas sp. B2M1-30]|uniref:hypothetical protein n=1 Tax=Pseudomonas TaxID=286 RepID=UPI0021C63062|nr:MULTISPECIES: hypothetical protein [Pseudomonas]MCU0120810.1 hypothetical protein [Pseudomonas sp. B2M1-30]MCU7260001.1 hypothetical protein [Pseudomonas koreensis]